MMKKLITPALVLLAIGILFADTTTSRFGLTKPDVGSTNWGPKLNTNSDTIDNAGGLTISNTWTNTNTFTGPFTVSTVTVNGTQTNAGLMSVSSVTASQTVTAAKLSVSGTSTFTGVATANSGLVSAGYLNLSSGTASSNFTVTGNFGVGGAATDKFDVTGSVAGDGIITAKVTNTGTGYSVTYSSSNSGFIDILAIGTGASGNFETGIPAANLNAVAFNKANALIDADHILYLNTATDNPIIIRENNVAKMQINTSSISVSANLVPSSTNTYSLGASALGWTSVFAVNGTIQTSNADQKTQIRELAFSKDRCQIRAVDQASIPTTMTKLADMPNGPIVPRGILFKWRNTGNPKQAGKDILGFMGNDLPEEAHALRDDGTRDPENFYTSAVIAIQSGAIRDLQVRVANQENRIAALEDAVAKLTAK